VEEFDYADAPSLTYATSTPLGEQDTTDGTQTVTVTNIGNAPLTFAGVSYAGDFPELSGASGACSTSTPLATGTGCTLPVNFTPTSTTGLLNESLVLTDNNLNATTTPRTQQTIALSGTALAAVVATQAVAATVLTQNHLAAAFTPVTGSGGDAPLAYSVSPGLPTGLTLNTSTGAITGTPTVASGAASYTVTVTDANGATAEANFSLTVDSAVVATQEIASEALTLNHGPVAFTPVIGTGGDAPLMYSVSPGLPTGLVLNTSTGAITGTPTVTSGAASYTVTVTDANGATATASFSLTVNAAVAAVQAIGVESLTFYQAATPFMPVTGSGGTSPLTYSVLPGLPAGLTLNCEHGSNQWNADGSERGGELHGDSDGRQRSDGDGELQPGSGAAGVGDGGEREPDDGDAGAGGDAKRDGGSNSCRDAGDAQRDGDVLRWGDAVGTGGAALWRHGAAGGAEPSARADGGDYGSVLGGRQLPWGHVEQ
jgi:hypothetical protein